MLRRHVLPAGLGVLALAFTPALAAGRSTTSHALLFQSQARTMDCGVQSAAPRSLAEARAVQRCRDSAPRGPGRRPVRSDRLAWQAEGRARQRERVRDQQDRYLDARRHVGSTGRRLQGHGQGGHLQQRLQARVHDRGREVQAVLRVMPSSCQARQPWTQITSWRAPERRRNDP